MPRVLHRQLRTANITIPAGNGSTATTTVPWDLGAVIVEQLEVMIPRGHAGLTGVRIAYQGVTLLPWGEPPDYVVANDETITVPVDLEIGAPLSVVGYNADVFVHTFYWRAIVNVWLTGDEQQVPPTLLDLSGARA